MSPRPCLGDTLTQLLNFSQVAKARLEEKDRVTAKDVVENGERLEAPVAFNSLIAGFSTR